MLISAMSAIITRAMLRHCMLLMIRRRALPPAPRHVTRDATACHTPMPLPLLTMLLPLRDYMPQRCRYDMSFERAMP